MGDFDFTRIEIAQRAVGLDAGYTDDANIDLELTDEIYGGLANDGAVATPNHAAGDDDLTLRLARQNARDIQVIGDHMQPLMMDEGARHLFGCRSDIDQ